MIGSRVLRCIIAMVTTAMCAVTLSTSAKIEVSKNDASPIAVSHAIHLEPSPANELNKTEVQIEEIEYYSTNVSEMHFEVFANNVSFQEVLPIGVKVQGLKTFGPRVLLDSEESSLELSSSDKESTMIPESQGKQLENMKSIDEKSAYYYLRNEKWYLDITGMTNLEIAKALTENQVDVVLFNGKDCVDFTNFPPEDIQYELGMQKPEYIIFYGNLLINIAEMSDEVVKEAISKTKSRYTVSNGVISYQADDSEELISAEITEELEKLNELFVVKVKEIEPAKEEKNVRKGVETFKGLPIDPFPATYLEELKMLSTAYCPCKKCCGKDEDHEEYGLTYGGINLLDGDVHRVVAADLKVLPLGTKVYIEEYGIATVSDIGGGVKGDHVDIYFPNHEEAWDWKYGMQQISVYVLSYPEGKTPIRIKPVETVETEVVPAETEEVVAETEVIPAETVETPVETEVVPAETVETPVETEVVPAETVETPVETEVVPAETVETPVETEAVSAEIEAIPV